MKVKLLKEVLENADDESDVKFMQLTKQEIGHHVDVMFRVPENSQFLYPDDEFILQIEEEYRNP